MKHTKANELIDKSATTIEIVICLIVILGVCSGIPKLIGYIVEIFRVEHLQNSYLLMNDFLKHALLLIVGIELIAMIITRSHESILTLILFVIARKMLVYSQGLTDILIGTVSVAIIFAVMKFILSDKTLIAKLDNTFDSSMSIEKLNREYGLNLPTMTHTLAGLIYELADKEKISEIHENTTIVYGPYVYRILSVDDGVVTRVRIEEN